MPKEAILCVDDEAVILLALKQELKHKFRDRYVIETALDAQEADKVVNDLEARGIATVLVLSDWFMPGARGDDFLVRLHERCPGIRAILLTGQADEASIERIRRDARLCAYLTKPWNNEELLSTVEHCLASDGCLSRGTQS